MSAERQASLSVFLRSPGGPLPAAGPPGDQGIEGTILASPVDHGVAVLADDGQLFQPGRLGLCMARQGPEMVDVRESSP